MEPDNERSKTESDYLTKAAMNGERALKIAFSAEPPDLVLLDVKMPGILKILMRSGTLYSVKAVNVSKAMADIYMQPPIDKYELLDLGPAHEIEKVGHQYAREVMSKQLHDNELLKSALLI
ncbi:MAG: hypothetical protein ACE1Z4_12985 [Gammaproteobacteria bacterium]